MIVVNDRYKFCRDCGRCYPRTKRFWYVHEPKGRAKFISAYCKPCTRTRSAETERRVYADPERRNRQRKRDRECRARWRKAHPELVREANVKRWQAIKADTTRYVREKQDRRIDNALRRDRPTRLDRRAVGAYRAMLSKSEHLDPQPFRDWLDETFPGMSTVARAEALGLGHKTLTNLATGAYRTISLPVVDRAFVNFGRPDLLEKLYPLGEACRV